MAAVVGYAGFEVDDSTGASAKMRPENFFARVGDFDWRFGFARGDSGDDLKGDDFALATESRRRQGV